MFYISRYQVIVALLFVMSIGLNAQRGNTNYMDFKAKPYFFGITLGFNSSDYKVFRSKTFITNDTIRVIEPKRGPGFNLGIITNLKLGEYFDIRFLPTLSFAERNLNYFSSTGSFNERKVESVFVDMPFHVRYKSAPFNDMRVFVIGGIKYSFDVASDSRTKQAKDLVKISPSDFSYEYGFGMQFYFPYFIFSPEFKVSQGINNILIYDKRIDQSNVIEKVMSRIFTISLNFEG